VAGLFQRNIILLALGVGSLGKEALPLFETLYRRQFMVRLQRAAAFAEGRAHYLEHLAKRGHAPATIRTVARDILAVAERIEFAPPAKATFANIGAAVDQWMQSKQRILPGVRTRMVNTAIAAHHLGRNTRPFRRA